MTSHMLDEIHEIPGAVARLLDEAGSEIGDAAELVRRRRPRWATIVGRGTSDHAATYARYLFESQLGLRSSLAATSTLSIYGARLDWGEGLVVAISQSGQSPDVDGYLAEARACGALTLAITNDPMSRLAATAQVAIDCRAGPEVAIPATKTYVTQLVAVAALVGGVVGLEGWPTMIAKTATQLDAVMEESEDWVERSGVVDEFSAAGRAIVLGRGHNLATALETALKLKETARVFAEGYSTADFEHGPVALVADDVPTVVFRPQGAIGRTVDKTLGRIRQQGGAYWVIGDGRAAPASDPGRPRLTLSPGPEALSPAKFVIPGLLLAEAVARGVGLDPDAPRGLDKVTLTV